MASYDLHLHTEWSYDAFTHVSDYFKMARDKGTRAIAITDHHLMDGYGDVLKAAAEFPEVGYLSGGELTVNCDAGDYDLVCLNLPRHSTPELADLWEIYHKWQRAYGHAVSENLCARGFAFDDDLRLTLLKSYRPEKAILAQGNSHVRHWTMLQYSIDHGFCKDPEDYAKLCSSFKDMPDYPEFDQVIPVVKRAGGIVILAHPNEYKLENDTKRLDYLRELFGLDGIESAHRSIPLEMMQHFRRYCEKYQLLSSGGSDLHNPRAEDFARHLGPDFWLDELLERVTIHHGA